MPLQVRLNFAHIEGGDIFIDLFEDQPPRPLAQTRVQLLLSPDIAVTHQSCSLSALRLRRLSALHQSP